MPCKYTCKLCGTEVTNVNSFLLIINPKTSGYYEAGVAKPNPPDLKIDDYLCHECKDKVIISIKEIFKGV